MHEPTEPEDRDNEVEPGESGLLDELPEGVRRVIVGDEDPPESPTSDADAPAPG